MASSFPALSSRLADLLGLTRRAAFFETGELVVDGRRLALHCDESGDEPKVVFHTICPAPDPRHKAGVHRLLLEANFLWVGTGIATFGVSPNSGQIVLCARLPLASLTAERMREILVSIARLADFWMLACDRMQRHSAPSARPAEHMIPC